MTDGGRRGNKKYRSAARHQVAWLGAIPKAAVKHPRPSAPIFVSNFCYGYVDQVGIRERSELGAKVVTKIGTTDRLSPNRLNISSCSSTAEQEARCRSFGPMQIGLEGRKDELIRQGLAWRAQDGSARSRKDPLSALGRQEVERVGQKLAGECGLSFRPIEDGQTIRATLIGLAQLASGRYAMIDDGFGFSLVPWRPVIENEIGREVLGVMGGHDVSW